MEKKDVPVKGTKLDKSSVPTTDFIKSILSSTSGFTSLVGIIERELVTLLKQPISDLFAQHKIANDSKDQVQSDAISAARDIIYNDIVDPIKEALLGKYQSEVSSKAATAAKSAQSTKKSSSTGSSMADDVLSPAEKAAEEIIKQFFESSSIRAEIEQIAKEMILKSVEEKTDEIKQAMKNVFKAHL